MYGKLKNEFSKTISYIFYPDGHIIGWFTILLILIHNTNTGFATE